MRSWPQQARTSKAMANVAQDDHDDNSTTHSDMDSTFRTIEPMLETSTSRDCERSSTCRSIDPMLDTSLDSGFGVESRASPDTGVLPLRLIGVLALVVVLFAGFLGGPNALNLLSKKATGSYKAPPGSLSLVAEDRLHHNFGKLAMTSEHEIVMAIRSKDGQKVLTPEVARFSANVSKMSHEDWRVKDMDVVVTGYFLGMPPLGLSPRDPLMKTAFVSADETMTLLMFLPMAPPAAKYHWTPMQVRDHVMAYLQELIDSAPAGIEVLLMGNPALQHDFDHDNSIESMLRAEICVLPFVLYIIHYLIQNRRLLLIPPITLAFTFLLSVAIVYPLSDLLPTYSNDIPPSMISVSIALSMDFSLFLLTRFNENLKQSMPLRENVETMMRHSGRTISLSGLLVSVAFFGSVLIPEGNLQAAGICLGITSLCCIAVNVTVTPALLYFFGSIFTKPCCGLCDDTTDPAAPPRTDRFRHGNEQRALLDDLAEAEQTPQGGARSTGNNTRGQANWLWLMRHVEKRPVVAILAVFMLFLPLIIQVPKLRSSADTYAMLPDTMPSIQAMRAVGRKGFPLGRFDPYTLVISHRRQSDVDKAALVLPSGERSAMLTPYSFRAMADLCDNVRKVGDIAGVIGPVQMMNSKVDWELAKNISSDSDEEAARQMRKLYQMMLRTHVNEQSAVIQLHTSFAPRGVGAADWVLAVRRKISEWEDTHPDFEATLSGASAKNTDIRLTVTKALPFYVGGTVIMVMALVLVMFRSLLLPLRLAFALLFTLSTTFGAAVIVYQTPLFHSVMPWLADHQGLTYESIPVALCIAIALGLDYDIFLISRIVEYRKLGLTDRDAIVYGVAKTGGIISGAGLIMSLAFMGLLLSPKVMHQQFAMLLIVSVMLDTFVVRTVLVPALMLQAQNYNWWPYKMPEPTIEVEAQMGDFDRIVQKEADPECGDNRPWIE